MVKAVGIDPGTMSMDIFGFDDETGEIIVDMSIPRDKITENPSIVIDVLRKINEKYKGIDVIAGPCGYGIPLKKASETQDWEIMLATFVSEEDVRRRLKIIGLRELMFLMKQSKDLNIWFTPGVIHLPTVPEFRKINRIDLGTADKVYTVIAAIRDHAEYYNIPYSDVSIIAVEIGFAYTAAIAVDKGKIVDGIGGTISWPGFLGMGFMDSELAYALANAYPYFSKTLLFRGGIADIADIDPKKTSLDEFVKLAKANDKVREAYNAMIEFILKDIATLLVSVRKPKEILLSGRFTRVKGFIEDLILSIKRFLLDYGLETNVRTIRRRAKIAKEGAEGAAILANGIAGGKYRKLIETMELFKSSGTIFDYIKLDSSIKKKIVELFTGKHK